MSERAQITRRLIFSSPFLPFLCLNFALAFNPPNHNDHALCSDSSRIGRRSPVDHNTDRSTQRGRSAACGSFECVGIGARRCRDQQAGMYEKRDILVQCASAICGQDFIRKPGMRIPVQHEPQLILFVLLNRLRVYKMQIAAQCNEDVDSMRRQVKSFQAMISTMLVPSQPPQQQEPLLSESHQQCDNAQTDTVSVDASVDELCSKVGSKSDQLHAATTSAASKICASPASSQSIESLLASIQVRRHRSHCFETFMQSVASPSPV